MKLLPNRIVLATAAAAALVGCQAGEQRTQKQAATAQWNGARAGVLGSLATDQYRAGNLDKSRQSVEQALGLDPKNANLHVLTARIDVEQGRLESAQERLAIAASLDPTNAEIDYLAGVVQQRWQRPEAARARYHAASEKKPDDLAYLMAEAEMLVELDRRPEALALLRARATYFEHSGAIRDAIAQLLEQAGNFPDAVEYYRQASVLDGDDLGTRERLGGLLYRGGEYREALSQLQRVLRAPEGAKRTDLMLMAAECELQVGSPQEARRRFDDVATLEPNSAAAWLGVAKCSLRVGDLRRAEGGAIKAAAILPGSGEMQLVLGYVRMKQGMFDEAMTCFRRASTADRSDATSLSMMGMLLERRGRTADALAMYGRALAIDPRDPLASTLLAAATAE